MMEGRVYGAVGNIAGILLSPKCKKFDIIGEHYVRAMN